MAADLAFLDWPFFEPRHRALARELDAWAAAHVAGAHGDDVDAECRTLVRALGGAGWLAHAIAGRAHGGSEDAIDTRAICLVRETLARHNGLADFAFAMQGLGSGAISLAGSAAQQATYLPRIARGDAIAAFALSEPDAGSDVAAMACAARIDGDSYLLDGEKTWISNGGIADFYVVFARTGDTGDPKSRERAASAPSSSIATRRASRSPSGSRSSRRIRSRGCALPPAVCRQRSGSVPKARASRSRCERSTSFALRSRRLRSASRGARSKRRWRARRRARCSAACSLTSS
jgi:hypothetical protein